MRQTRNLKMLRPNPLFRYELRVEPFRVFFDVEEATQVVFVLAVGRKEGNRVMVGGIEVSL